MSIKKENHGVLPTIVTLLFNEIKKIKNNLLDLKNIKNNKFSSGGVIELFNEEDLLKKVDKTSVGYSLLQELRSIQREIAVEVDCYKKIFINNVKKVTVPNFHNRLANIVKTKNGKKFVRIFKTVPLVKSPDTSVIQASDDLNFESQGTNVDTVSENLTNLQQKDTNIVKVSENFTDLQKQNTKFVKVTGNIINLQKQDTNIGKASGNVINSQKNNTNIKQLKAPLKKLLPNTNCRLCSEKIATVEMKELHENKHIEKKNKTGEFVCEFCNETFKHRYFILQHLFDNHINDYKRKKGVCPICGTQFSSIPEMNIHVLTHNNSSKKTSESTDKSIGDELQKTTNTKKSKQPSTRKYSSKKKTATLNKGDDSNKTILSYEFVENNLTKKMEVIVKKRVNNVVQPNAGNSNSVAPESSQKSVSKPPVPTQKEIPLPPPGPIIDDPYDSDYIITCSICYEKFPSEEVLKFHQQTHLGKINIFGRYTCMVCNRLFKNTKLLLRHLILHNQAPKPKVFKCNICEKEFTRSYNFNNHLATHENVRRFVCAICDKGYTTKRSLDAHTRKHDPDYKKCPCPVCGKLFATNTNVEVHMRSHTGEKPYQCDICGKRYQCQSDARKHAFYHTGVRPHKCTLCPKGFVTKQMLRDHMVVHTGVRAFMCEVCSKTFLTKSALRIHSKRHNGNDREHQCDICLKRFQTAAYLVGHKRLHTGEKPFNCKVCGKAFNLPGHATQHERFHELRGQKLFDCDRCDKSFHSKTRLRQHTQYHDNDRRFKCGICSKGFVVKSHVQRHLKTHKNFGVVADINNFTIDPK